MHRTCLIQPQTNRVAPAHPRAVTSIRSLTDALSSLSEISPRLRLEVEAAGVASVDPRTGAPSRPAVRRSRILIVDDDPDMRLYVRRCLASAVPPVDEIQDAPDGLIALEMLDKMEVDLIITDVVMPRLDGLSFYAQLRTETRHAQVAVLFVSAVLQETDLVSRLGRHPDLGFLAKPFSAHFCRSFKQDYGKAPSQYMRDAEKDGAAPVPPGALRADRGADAGLIASAARSCAPSAARSLNYPLRRKPPHHAANTGRGGTRGVDPESDLLYPEPATA